MMSRGWLIRVTLGGLTWAWLGLGLAQAGAVPPTNPTTLMHDTTSSVTVSLYQLDSTLPATVSLQSPSRCTSTGTSFYRDVTDCWMPEWSSPASGGKPVYVVVNGSTALPTLVPPTTVGVSFPLGAGAANPFVAGLTTSAYPGQCTNVGSGAEADFTLASTTPVTLQTSTATSVVGYALTPTDCGGMAVIQVGTFKFILPRDGTATLPANGIPEVWENLYGGNLDPTQDVDIGPVATSPIGDGLSTFDEYRGFIVSGKQIRTDPRQKDLFVHVVNPGDSNAGVFVTSPSCGMSCFGGGTNIYPVAFSSGAALTVPAAAATVGATATFTASSAIFSSAHVQGEIIGNAGGRATIIEVTGPTSATVTAQITQAFSAGSLPANSWRLRESLFALAYGSVPPERLHLLGYAPGSTNSPQTIEWVDKFASLLPAQTLNITDSTNDRVVNPNRIYCLPPGSPSPCSPSTSQKGIRVMEGLNTNSSSVLGWSFGVASPNQAGNVVVFTQRIISYLDSLIATNTTINYSTASLVNGVWTWSTPVTVNRDFLLSKAFQFYTGHEIHHSLSLTPQVQGTNKVTYGNHWAPGTGDCLDQAITTTSKNGTVTFYIPSICGTVDEASFIIR
jgi:hypothetical protein